jgi:HAD superfamily hydrolase (TIGR01509 family)
MPPQTGTATWPDQEAAGGGEPLAVLFDMDGLLVDTEPLWFEVEQAVMTRLGGNWAPQDQVALIGGSLQHSVGYFLDRAARPFDPGQVASWLIGGMAALIGERGAAIMPGAAELHASVRSAGITTALVTSSERVIMDAVLAQLAGHGIEFDVTVCHADVRNTKPDPEPYRLAARLAGADPSCCVAIEDSPTGVAAAEAAGCVTVAVPSLVPIGQRPGRLVASSLAEVDLDTLRKLMTAAKSSLVRAGTRAASPQRCDRAIAGP